MKRRILWLLIMICSLGMAAGPACAVSLSLLPSFQSIPVGGVASVDLVIGGLGNFADPSLGAFDVDISYNASILGISASDVIFGPYLGDPALFEADAFASVSPGSLHLDEISFLLPSELDALQPDAFTLATLNFTGLMAGFSSLDFKYASLSDAFGSTIADVTTTGAGVAVPEPATLILLGTGLFGLAGFRRIVKRR